ncbi:hypothetical protein AD998_17075 [bacterium 336/3]|nr:hypothetical protein AD998_17075 [bacterium 336/3]
MHPETLIGNIGEEYILDRMFFKSIQDANTFLEPYKCSILEYSKNNYDIDWHKQGVFYKSHLDIFYLPDQTLQQINFTQQKSFWLLFYTNKKHKDGFSSLNASILLLDVSLEFLEVFLDDLCFLADKNWQPLIILEKSFLYFFSIANFGDTYSNVALSSTSKKIELSPLYAQVYSLKNENFKQVIRDCQDFNPHFFKNPEVNDIKFFLHHYTIACHENNDHEELKKLYALADVWDMVDDQSAFDWFYENLSMNYAFEPTKNNASILDYFNGKPLHTVYNSHTELLAIRKKNFKG